MAQEHRHLAGDQRADRVQWIGAPGGHDLELQAGELRGERLGVGQIGLRQAQDRSQPADVGGDQGAFDEPGARWRIGQGHHDQKLIGIGDDDAFSRVGVIGGAAQHRSPFSPADDPGQRVGSAGYVTDDAHVVADDDGGAPEFPRAHGRDDARRVTPKRAPPPAAVDRHDHRGDRRSHARLASHGAHP